MKTNQEGCTHTCTTHAHINPTEIVTTMSRSQQVGSTKKSMFSISFTKEKSMNSSLLLSNGVYSSREVFAP